jgi:tetratricopeptide (TPR) repeat protein
MQRYYLTALFFALLPIAVHVQAQQNGTSPGGEAPAAALSPFETAQNLAAKGRLEQAQSLLAQLAAQVPEEAGVERLRGIIFYQEEKFTEAIAAFAKAAAQDPKDRESVEMRGVSLFRLGRAGEALPFLEKAHFAVERANIDPQYVLGLCYADLQRYSDARHAFAAQYGFAPDSAEAYLLAARLFLRREFAAEAAAEARKALEINPALPLAHQLLGEAALAKGDIPAAIQELEAERKINPLNGTMYDRLGDAYLRNEQYAEAQQSLNRAVLLEPNATAPYILLGEVFIKQKQPIQALHYLDRAVKMDPSNYITHNLLGQAYKATGQMQEANREFKTGVELQHHQVPQAAGK